MGCLPKTRQTTSRATGDDGYYQKGFNVTPRFVDLGNNTFLDRATKLQWIKDYSVLGSPWNAKQYFLDALTNANALTYVGFSDWRIPNLHELNSVCNWQSSTNLFDSFTIPASIGYVTVMSSTHKAVTIIKNYVVEKGGEVYMDFGDSETPWFFLLCRGGVK
jgi:hypothetical protein